MSTFNEEITLVNVRDRALAFHGVIASSEIRSLTVEACVDTGAWNLVLNEDVRARLGLELDGSEFSTLADGTTVEYPMTEPVEIRWENRKFTLNAQVIPTADEILLGAFPMEALDVIADPVEECLKGRHGDKPLRRLK
ncbi:MAG: aspartyl protease family protein [Spirochaetaceae bacterium]|jgi:clan AA aspartic protease|nr:aspartyl protease family protein [Spirochaetaceae bacterium]